MNIEERKNKHKAIGLMLCLFGFVFVIVGVFIENYTWHFFAIAGGFVVVLIYHQVKYWSPILKEYNKSKLDIKGEKKGCQMLK